MSRFAVWHSFMSRTERREVPIDCDQYKLLQFWGLGNSLSFKTCKLKVTYLESLNSVSKRQIMRGKGVHPRQGMKQKSSRAFKGVFFSNI